MGKLFKILLIYIFTFVLFLTYLYSNVYSNESSSFKDNDAGSTLSSVQVSIGKNYIFGSHNFIQVREITNCCDVVFDNNIGRAIQFDLGYYYNLDEFLDFPIKFYFGLGFNSSNMTFRRTQNILLGLDTNLIEGAFEHKVTFDYDNYIVELGGEIDIIDKLNFKISILTNYTHTYNFYQIEQIKKPIDRGVFINETGNPEFDDKRTRNIVKKDFIENRVIYYFNGELSYQLPIKFNKIQTSISIAYQIGLNQMLENVDWKTDILRTKFNFSLPL